MANFSLSSSRTVFPAVHLSASSIGELQLWRELQRWRELQLRRELQLWRELQLRWGGRQGRQADGQQARDAQTVSHRGNPASKEWNN